MPEASAQRMDEDVLEGSGSDGLDKPAYPVTDDEDGEDDGQGSGYFEQNQNRRRNKSKLVLINYLEPTK